MVAMPQRQQYYAAGPQEGGVMGRSMRGGNNGQEPGGPGGMADPPKQDPPPLPPPPLPPPRPPEPPPEPQPEPAPAPAPPPPDGGQVPPPPGGEAGLPPEPDPPGEDGYSDYGYGYEGYDYGTYWDEFGDEKYGWRPPGVGSVFNAVRDPNAPIDLGDFRYKNLYGQVYWDRMTDNPGGSLGWQPENKWLPYVEAYSDPGAGAGGGFNFDLGRMFTD
jgi:hypothetical protein